MRESRQVMDGRPRLRAVLAALLIGVAVCSAGCFDSVGHPESSVSSQPTIITLDRAHGLGSTLVDFTLPAEVVRSTSPYYWEATFWIDEMEATDAASKPIPAGTAIKLRILETTATADDANPLAMPDSTAEPGHRQWTIDPAVVRYLEIPLDCRAPGPCAHTFRVVATLDQSAASGSVTWHVDTTTTWNEGAFSSPPAASIDVKQPVLVAGSAPAMDVGTPTESIVLGAEHPTVVREVEVSLAASAKGLPRASLRAAISTVESAFTPSSQILGIIGWGRPAQTPGAASSATPLPAISDAADPFSGCGATTGCVRRFLVIINWKFGPTATFDWQLVVTRNDLAQVLNEEPGRVALKTIASLDPVGPPSSVHLEGEIRGSWNAARHARIQLRVTRTLSTAASDNSIPIDEHLAEILPIPGAMHLRATIDQDPLVLAGLSVDVGAQDTFGVTALAGVILPDSLDVNPFLVCKPDASCPQLDLFPSGYYIDRVEDGTYTFHWALDIQVYSYPGLTYTVQAQSVEPTPAPSRT